MFTQSYAKLNLSLDVCGIRDDGYHDMNMIMQTISLCDDITITKTSGGEIRAKTNIRYLPENDSNLAVKAAKVFMNEIQNSEDAFLIAIKKRIPVGAGMAGGSSNASAVLRLLNREYGNPLSAQRLIELSDKIGSDVSFCTLGGTALAKGKGERLQPLNDLPDCKILIVKPEFSISTPEFFNAIDKIKLKRHPNTKGIIEALESNDLDNICRRMYNVFEDVPDKRLKVVPEIKRKLIDAGAKGAVMTGTGSAVFGIFDLSCELEKEREELKKEYGFCKIARPVKRLLDKK